MTVANVILWYVDAQTDFMLPDGELYVPGAEKLLPNIDRLGRLPVGTVFHGFARLYPPSR
jgi:nicotinamidase-related amidase